MTKPFIYLPNQSYDREWLITVGRRFFSQALSVTVFSQSLIHQLPLTIQNMLIYKPSRFIITLSSQIDCNSGKKLVTYGNLICVTIFIKLLRLK